MNDNIDIQSIANELEEQSKKQTETFRGKHAEELLLLQPAIEKALSNGMSKKAICEFLRSKGLDIKTGTFAYILNKLGISKLKTRRFKRKQQASCQGNPCENA